jgi:hypothetical protein
MTFLHLNAFLMTTGHHEASWRLPESDPLASLDIEPASPNAAPSTHCSSPTHHS